MGVLEIINVLFMIFFFVIAYISVRYFINQIEKYPRVTHEEVYDSKNITTYEYITDTDKKEVPTITKVILGTSF